MERIRRVLADGVVSLKARPVLMWVVVAGVLLLAIFYREQVRAAPEISATERASESVDTFIPAGFVLVPIEVVNYESLDSVLGRFGVVDLFAVDPANGNRAQQVASRIRILRAPKNPSQFAVLAPEEQSQTLVRQAGGFYVIVQNPQSSGTAFETPTSTKPRRARVHVEMIDE
jgi:hypothetical protein